MPPLDPRVPVRQDSGARGLRHVRVLGDTSGRLARLTSEQHLARRLRKKKRLL